MSYVEDAATRADQSGWGTADGGDDSDLTWNGGTTNFSVVSNKLVIPTDFARFYNRIGDNHSPPFTLTFDVTDLSTGGQFGGIEAIILSTGSEQEYRIAFRRDNGSGNTDLRIIMRDGSENVLASDDTLSDPGSDIEFKVEVTESGGDLTIKVKVWAQGSSEPGSWTLETTESPATYTTGGIGLAGANQTSGSDMKFDNLVWEELAVAPTAPDNVSASEGDDPGDLDVSWDDNSSDEDHFNLKYREAGSGDPFTVVQVPANVTSWTLSLEPDTTYDIRVTAENEVGESTYESGVTGTAKTVSLSTPTLAEHAGTDEDEVWLEYSSIDPNADTLIIERAPDSGGSPGTWAQIDSISSPADPAQYNDTGRSAATKYWYRAKAQDSGGSFTDSAYSTAFVVQTPYAPPTSITVGTPTGSGPYSVPITFNGENASATHEVWRAPDSGGSPGSFSLIGEAPAGDDFEDTSAPSNDMWYRARASSPGAATSSYTAAVQASPGVDILGTGSVVLPTLGASGQGAVAVAGTGSAALPVLQASGAGQEVFPEVKEITTRIKTRRYIHTNIEV